MTGGDVAPVLYIVVPCYNEEEIIEWSYSTPRKKYDELVGRVMYIFVVLCLAQWCIDTGFKKVMILATALFVLISAGCVFSGRLKTDLKDGFAYKCAKDFITGF